MEDGEEKEVGAEEEDLSKAPREGVSCQWCIMGYISSLYVCSEY